MRITRSIMQPYGGWNERPPVPLGPAVHREESVTAATLLGNHSIMWLLFLMMAFIIFLILSSTKSPTETTLLPNTDTHFLTSLSNLLRSLAVIQLPQHTTAKNTALATTDW